MKKCLLLKINTITKFPLFIVKQIIDEGFYLITDTYNYLIIPMRKRTYSFI